MLLQRRSKDGFVSATGMFKIAFPWATHAEEKEERDYLKSLDATSEDEVAGNVWISPEYGMDASQIYRAFRTDLVLQPSNSRRNTA
jgi:hypothetical protein